MREAIITLTFSLAEAEGYRDSLADILCWCNGFMAASPDNSDRHPMGVSSTRDLNIKLRGAIDKALLAQKETA